MAIRAAFAALVLKYVSDSRQRGVTERKWDLTEGYPCVHSRTISLQTVRRYGTIQCGQDRDEFPY